MKTLRISRNAPCPCGSGKKFKLCCLPRGGFTPRDDRQERTLLGKLSDEPKMTAIPRKSHLTVEVSYPAEEGTGEPHRVCLGKDEDLQSFVHLPELGQSVGGLVWEVMLEMDVGDGHTVEVELLRPKSWVVEHGAVEGGTIQLEMPEQGLCGPAAVKSVRKWGLLPEGPIATGFFRHSIGWLYDLQVSGEPEPIGTTATHPFFSSDRNAWIPAGELKVGERLLARDGSTPLVESFTPRPHPEPVFNIEVAGDHCYRVGAQGLLVHNRSVACPDKCEERWGLPTAAPNALYYHLVPATVTYKARGDDRGRVFPTLKGKEITEKVVGVMYFRGENYKPEVPGLQAIQGQKAASERARNWVMYAVGESNLDRAGHVIHDRWGGPGDLPSDRAESFFQGNAVFLNIVPLNNSVNSRGAWKRAEDKYEALIAKNDIVCVRIDFEYHDQDHMARPSSITWQYYYRNPMGEWKMERIGPFGNY
jgi:hypothetical protein